MLPAWKAWGAEFRGIGPGSQLAARFMLETGDAQLEQLQDPDFGAYKEDALVALFNLSARRAVEWSLKEPELRIKCYARLPLVTQDRYFELIPEPERPEVLIGLAENEYRSLQEVSALAKNYHQQGLLSDDSLQRLSSELDKLEEKQQLEADNAPLSPNGDPFGF